MPGPSHPCDEVRRGVPIGLARLVDVDLPGKEIRDGLRGFRRPREQRDREHGEAAEGTSRLLLFEPWVYQGDAEGVEVLRIARNDSEAMLKGRGRDHAVRNAKGITGGLPLGIEYAPALSDSLRYGKHALRKPQRDDHLDKMLQLRSSGAGRKKRNAAAKFAEGHDAEELGILALAFQPPRDSGVRPQGEAFLTEC